ncbi:germ cell-less protein-like 1 [Haliotis rufescens]|uniref:germ cell-less protein-like 1 n=1 Tax=Haliotis rufescens TaxID=6454 RepID=UPI00201F54FA|nr:germ cell-less protein-like 1 [Haliotis rufescens]
MGNSLTRLIPGNRTRKRKRADDTFEKSSDDSSNDDGDSLSESDSSPARKSRTVDIHTPKRKHIKSTSKYIYETLFMKGENSDVTIRALGRDWHLHKHYLKQSGYFCGMLSGSWRESSQDVIQLDIPDNNVDEKALKTALGCLYKDDVVLKPVDVIGVLAAATLLQMDGLIKHCTEFMKETISSSTAVTYQAASQMYSLPDVAAFCQGWMLHNVMAPSNLAILKDISEDLMPTLVSSGELWVLQVEMDLYTLLKKWIFLRNNLTWSGRRCQLMSCVDAFFKQLTGDECYLESSDGRKYIKSFESLRWQYVVNDIASLRLIEADRIIPKAWLTSIYRFQWHQLLHVEQGLDKGPQDVEEQVFLARAMRCGRVLPSNEEFCWRWVGYSYGIDGLITYKSRLISLMRNNSSSLNYPGSVSLQPHRSMYIRLTASNINEHGCVMATKSTGIKKISLDKNESVVLLNLENGFKFPLYITVCSLMTTPNPALSVPRLDVKLYNSATCQAHRRNTREQDKPDTIASNNIDDMDQSYDHLSNSCQTDHNSNDESQPSQSLSPQAESLLAYLRRSKSSSPTESPDTDR